MPENGDFREWGYNWGYRKGLHFSEKGVTLLGYGGAKDGGVYMTKFPHSPIKVY